MSVRAVPALTLSTNGMSRSGQESHRRVSIEGASPMPPDRSTPSGGPSAEVPIPDGCQDESYSPMGAVLAHLPKCSLSTQNC